jgi:GNAT superfamily N-acetyltransferase
VARDQRRPAEEDGVRRLAPGDPDLPAVLRLIQGAFAYMDGRIDPPSSMQRMTLESLDRLAAEGEIWAIGHPVQASFVLTRRPESLYLGKLAVAPTARGRGLARRLVEHAERRARELGLPCVELQTRVELVENHATFAALGFQMVGETAHPGFDHPTSLTFRRPVSRESTPALP